MASATQKELARRVQERGALIMEQLLQIPNSDARPDLYNFHGFCAPTLKTPWSIDANGLLIHPSID